jgi:hypothetical protein
MQIVGRLAEQLEFRGVFRETEPDGGEERVLAKSAEMNHCA